MAADLAIISTILAAAAPGSPAGTYSQLASSIYLAYLNLGKGPQATVDGILSIAQSIASVISGGQAFAAQLSQARTYADQAFSDLAEAGVVLP